MDHAQRQHPKVGHLGWGLGAGAGEGLELEELQPVKESLKPSSLEPTRIAFN